MSTYTGVTNFQKTVRFFGPPCILVPLKISGGWNPSEVPVERAELGAARELGYSKTVRYGPSHLAVDCRPECGLQRAMADSLAMDIWFI